MGMQIEYVSKKHDSTYSTMPLLAGRCVFGEQKFTLMPRFEIPQKADVVIVGVLGFTANPARSITFSSRGSKSGCALRVGRYGEGASLSKWWVTWPSFQQMGVEGLGAPIPFVTQCFTQQ